jgi:hypothetical protein
VMLTPGCRLSLVESKVWQVVDGLSEKDCILALVVVGMLDNHTVVQGLRELRWRLRRCGCAGLHLRGRLVIVLRNSSHTSGCLYDIKRSTDCCGNCAEKHTYSFGDVLAQSRGQIFTY